MATERRNQLVLGAALLVLAIVGYRALIDTSTAPAATSNARGRSDAGASSARGATPTAEAPAVHLDSLEEERPKPGGPERNLFRFKPKAPPPPPPGASRSTTPVAPVTSAPPVPTGPPPPPPITLKFVGLIDPGAGQPKIAVLTDGAGPPIHGVEGGTVMGKYRILRIGAESIEMAYLDGRGRQTIRFSGS